MSQIQITILYQNGQTHAISALSENKESASSFKGCSVHFTIVKENTQHTAALATKSALGSLFLKITFALLYFRTSHNKHFANPLLSRRLLTKSFLLTGFYFGSVRSPLRNTFSLSLWAYLIGNVGDDAIYSRSNNEKLYVLENEVRDKTGRNSYVSFSC